MRPSAAELPTLTVSSSPHTVPDAVSASADAGRENSSIKQAKNPAARRFHNHLFFIFLLLILIKLYILLYKCISVISILHKINKNNLFLQFYDKILIIITYNKGVCIDEKQNYILISALFFLIERTNFPSELKYLHTFTMYFTEKEKEDRKIFSFFGYEPL